MIGPAPDADTFALARGIGNALKLYAVIAAIAAIAATIVILRLIF